MTLVVKNLPANAGDVRDAGLIPESGRSLGEGNDNPFHGQRRLVGYRPWGGKELDKTERMHAQCSLQTLWKGRGYLQRGSLVNQWCH